MPRVPMDGGPDVSHETFDRLRRYADLLGKWQRSINLVARSTLSDIWSRHILDSLQIHGHIPEGARHLADFGSGGGFPGLVLAIALAGDGADIRVTLVESDRRKCAFLREVARQTGTPVLIRNDRIEALPPLRADVVTARALAPLSELLRLAHRHLTPMGVCLFPKGAAAAEELEAARRGWHFDCESVTSRTARNAVLLKIEGIGHVPPDAA